jgi:hypothetical protein
MMPRMRRQEVHSRARHAYVLDAARVKALRLPLCANSSHSQPAATSSNRLNSRHLRVALAALASGLRSMALPSRRRQQHGVISAS